LETEKKCFRDLFSSVFLQFKEYHPSGNLKFHNIGIFQSVKFCNLMEKILPISLKLKNISPNTLGCFNFNAVRFNPIYPRKSACFEPVFVVGKPRDSYV